VVRKDRRGNRQERQNGSENNQKFGLHVAPHEREMLDSLESSCCESLPAWQNCTLLQEIIHGLFLSISIAFLPRTRQEF
jgi:hypothetical protein